MIFFTYLNIPGLKNGAGASRAIVFLIFTGLFMIVYHEFPSTQVRITGAEICRQD